MIRRAPSLRFDLCQAPRWGGIDRDSKNARVPRPDKVDKINILAGIIKAEIAIAPDLNGYLAA
jgi:hypothetical protein